MGNEIVKEIAPEDSDLFIEIQGPPNHFPRYVVMWWWGLRMEVAPLERSRRELSSDTKIVENGAVHRKL